MIGFKDRRSDRRSPADVAARLGGQVRGASRRAAQPERERSDSSRRLPSLWSDKPTDSAGGPRAP